MTQHNNPRPFASWLGRWIFAAASLLATSLAVADMPTSEELLSKLAVPKDKIAELDQGKIISYKINEGTDKELADGIAAYVQAPLDKVIAFVKRGDFASLDSTVTAQGEIPTNATVDALKRFSLSGKEAQNLLEVEAGSDFNLSQEEIARFTALKDTLGSADKKAMADGVSKAYRDILLQRYNAYKTSGLSGIAPYTRGGSDQADPAAELRQAAEASIGVGQYFPAIHQVWLNYPQALPTGTTERFLWANRTVEDRPTATLHHRLTYVQDTGALVLARQFYVGHSYNSSQIVTGCLPYRDGALLFYILRSSTDQVAGVGSGMKHSIGRGRMQAEMVKQLEKLRNSVK